MSIETARLDWQRSCRLLQPLQQSMVDAIEADGVLKAAALHHLGTPGKRLRGRLALATGAAFGVAPRAMLPIAAGVEMLHEASLVHDDLQDRDRQRRGAESVWSCFGDDVALILGDYLIATAMSLFARAPAVCAGGVVQRASIAVSRLGQGQLLDLRLTPETISGFDEYETMVRFKTGALLSLPVEVAAVVGGQRMETAQLIGDAMSWLGVAYQVLDDFADLDGSKDRNAQSDLRQRRPSAVWLHARALNVDPLRQPGADDLVREACTDHASRALRYWQELAARLPEPPRRVLEAAGREIALGPSPGASPMAALMGFEQAMA